MMEMLEEFIGRGWRELCLSEWTSPCFVFPKNVAGKWWLVVDYCDLNSESQHDASSLPLIDNLLRKQQGKRIFSVLNLKNGFHQMPLARSSQDATAVSTPLGLMLLKVMPMEVKNGNAQFRRMTEDLR